MHVLAGDARNVPSAQTGPLEGCGERSSRTRPHMGGCDGVDSPRSCLPSWWEKALRPNQYPLGRPMLRGRSVGESTACSSRLGGVLGLHGRKGSKSAGIPIFPGSPHVLEPLGAPAVVFGVNRIWAYFDGPMFRDWLQPSGAVRKSARSSTVRRWHSHIAVEEAMAVVYHITDV